MRAMPTAARPSGVGAMPRGACGESGGTTFDWAVANEPVTAPAQAGWRAVGSARPIDRRPFARSTACPTWAAKAIAIATVPIGKRNVARMFIREVLRSFGWSSLGRRRRGIRGRE